jgi:hypothetical protein
LSGRSKVAIIALIGAWVTTSSSSILRPSCLFNGSMSMVMALSFRCAAA